MPEITQANSPDNARDVTRRFGAFFRLEGSAVLALLQSAVSEWSDDRVPRLSASLAYYSLLSIAPLLVVVVAVAALVFGKKAAEGQLFWQLQGWLGSEGANSVQGLLRNAQHPGTGIFATVVGILILLFAASSVVIELEDALNTIWGVPTPKSKSKLGDVLVFLKQRFNSFLMILGTGCLLLLSVILNTVISALGAFFDSVLPVPAVVLQIAEFMIAFCITTMLFAAIYKFVPSVRLKWSDVFIGATVTSLFFTIGKQLVGLYLGRESFGSTYGAAGSLVAILVWVYYSAQLFFLGAEFTKVYTRRYGSLKHRPT